VTSDEWYRAWEGGVVWISENPSPVVTGNQKCSKNGNGRAAKMGTRIQQNREQEYSDKLTEY
jgi:hypothetical protein